MFSITTPIYYVNDEPHLGHAYTTVLADVLARYHRLRGDETFFLTGVDEHGQKVFNAVRRNQVSDPQAYVDGMAGRFQSAWQNLKISNDDFIRTTQPRHRQVVAKVLQQLWDAGEIYRGEYEGWYCIPDERFWTEKDLLAGADGALLCPDCARPVEKIVEANYFFRMSRYQEWLVGYIDAHPDFIQPAYRRNEVSGFLRQPLGDLCISRPAARMSWGIPLPFDSDYVTYVWFDALLNYITAAGYLDDPERFARQWPNTLHLIGKDILTTHAVYWPIMLQAAGLPQPRAIFAHGWWSVGGLKMGKSLGNAVRPLDLAEIFGVDAFRYFLMREMTPGLDSDFDSARIASRYTVDLANNLGNLLQRVTSMAASYLGSELALPVAPSQPGDPLWNDLQLLRARVEALPEQVFAKIDSLEVNAALGLCMDVLGAVNGFVEHSAPWALAKAGDLGRVGWVLAGSAEALRIVTILLSPVLPGKAGDVFSRLGWDAPDDLSGGLSWGGRPIPARTATGDPLFPRVE